MKIALPDITVKTQIYESINSLVYRGTRRLDNTNIILKVLKQDYPTTAELIRYKQEYEITRSLNLEGVIKAYSQQDYQRTLVIILEDFGGESLEKLREAREISFPMPLAEFLRLAIAITKILGRIHATNVIHKDINPSNIVLNPQTGIVKIIDFGIATRLTRTNPTFKNLHVLEGTLAYMSPEQTGRMNRSLDYRTDFYSLGVTFYELLTGRLPFLTTDVLELVHCHIAQQPIPVHQVNLEIPPIVSAIVMKLMAKNAEDRYQNSWGIKADLEECLKQLETSERIETFSLGLHDISDKFQIPQKLYGRETEIEALLAAFERVARGETEEAKHSKIEMMLVAGYSGIGKSSLVYEIYKPITEKSGYFISGKFDQFKRNIPYSAVVDAFQELVKQLLSESETQLQRWRDKLLTALGANGQIIIDVIPEVESILGKQPDIPNLGATESQNRFNRVFQNFIRVFCDHEHPLVIFLDDLQWVDSATLKLIELMMSDRETQYLFLIGAYRDNEVNPTHPLTMTLEGLKKAEAAIAQITLAPLEINAIAKLIAETLHSDTNTVKPLTELVVSKTGGNPFFVNEFLKTLYAENLIAFNLPKNSEFQENSRNPKWNWDIAEIEAQDITDNVVELTIAKLKKLPNSTQQILQLAACVGADFDLNTLSIICEKSPQEIFPDLVESIELGLILPVSELDETLLIQNYKFLHDRIQQAACALIDESRQQVVHVQIGRNLLQNTDPEALSEKIFEIIDHFNLGIELISDRTERDEIARLHLMGAQKAKAATAYSAAKKYLTTAIELLAVNSWDLNYAFTLSVYEEATEMAYLCGDFDEMEKWATIVLQQAKNILDKEKVYEVKILTSVAQRKPLEAIDLGLQVLKMLGIVLPKLPNSSDIQQRLEKTQATWKGKNIADLINLPLMTDADRLAAIRILSSITAAAYVAAPLLLPLIVCEQVNLSIAYGNIPFSAYAYAAYGIILSGIVNDSESAYQFGQLALNLVERLNAKAIKCRTFHVVAVASIHATKHLKETLAIYQEAYSSGIENGDLEYASYAAYSKCQHSYSIGLELPVLEREMAYYSDAIAQLKQETAFNWHQIFRQSVLNLLGKEKNPCCLSGEAYNEEKFLPLHLAANDRTGLHFLYANKSILCYLFEEFDRALEYSISAEPCLDGVTGLANTSQFYFYDSLVRLMVYPSISHLEQENFLLKVTNNQEKMQGWAHHAPMNFQHKYALVEAEKSRVLSHFFEAEEYYEQAILGASEHGYIQEEALAYELAAKFYLARGREKFAKTYMKEAHYCYDRWGAKAKVADLEAKYSHLLTQSPTVNRTTNTYTKKSITTTSGSSSKEALDLAAAMKASQAISGEIVLDKLLTSLMKILIENAGAQTGFLILEDAGKWKIEAACEIDSATGEDDCTIEVLPSILIENRLSAAIINYVIHTKESVVLNDATREGKFTLDPYIREHKPKSILCAPLLDRGQLSGIMYLENNLTTRAFSDDRLKILQLLSGQAAIAITNAKLYAEVKERESRLTQFIDAMPVAVSVLDRNGRICYVNQMTYQLCGMNAMPETITEEFLEQIQIYQTGTDRLYLQEQLPIVRSLQGETVTVDDMEFRHSDRIIPISVSSTPVFDEMGKTIYAIAAFQDISERKQAEKLLADYNQTLQQQVFERTILLSQEIEERKRVENALRQSEEQRRLTMDFTYIGSWNWNIVEDTTEWNDNHARLLGLVPGEVESSYQAWRDRVYPEDIEQVEQAINYALETHTDFNAEYRVIYPDGSIHWLAGRGRGMYNQAGEPVRMLGVILDISDRKRAEEALVIEERNRMAREIHDTLAQAFTGIIIHSRSASSKLTTDAEKAQTHLSQTQELARSGLTEARRSVEALRRPYLLENGHLHDALARLVTQMRLSADTRIVCETSGTAYTLPADVENNLLRIGQEALTNAIKYAWASEIRIELVYEPTQCLLRVKDDGRGFEVDSIPSSGGFGLLGMSERAKHIGAQLTLQSQPGRGTEIIVAID